MTSPSSPADLIEELRADLAKMAEGERQFWAAKLTPLLDALSSQSRELSEAREEIERLRAALKPFVDACPDSIVPDFHPMSGTGLGDEWRPNLFVRDFRRAKSVLAIGSADLQTSDPDHARAPVTSGAAVARRDDPFRPAVDVDADDDYYPSRDDD